MDSGLFLLYSRSWHINNLQSSNNFKQQLKIHLKVLVSLSDVTGAYIVEKDNLTGHLTCRKRPGHPPIVGLLSGEERWPLAILTATSKAGVNSHSVFLRYKRLCSKYDRIKSWSWIIKTFAVIWNQESLQWEVQNPLNRVQFILTKPQIQYLPHYLKHV